MKKVLITGWAVALAALWTVGAATPVRAAEGESTKDKLQNTGEKAKDKLQDVGEKTKDKLQNAGEKTKDKLIEAKDKVKEKVTGKGSDVKSAQQALMDKGFNPGPIDGKMGPKTSAALKEYQKAEGLTVTGKLDSETSAKLSAAGKASEATPSASPAGSPTGTETPAKKQQ